MKLFQVTRSVPNWACSYAVVAKDKKDAIAKAKGEIARVDHWEVKPGDVQKWTAEQVKAGKVFAWTDVLHIEEIDGGVE